MKPQQPRYEDREGAFFLWFFLLSLRWLIVGFNSPFASHAKEYSNDGH